MKREIKFRGRNITTGDWVYGCLVNCFWTYSKHHSLCGQSVCDILVAGELDDWDGLTDNEDLCITVDPKTVGQFTGLLDKNGIKIYDGDIVEKDGDSWQILWDEHRAGFRFLSLHSSKRKFWGTELRIPDSVGCQRYLMAEMTIVGNIFENPELLIP